MLGNFRGQLLKNGAVSWADVEAQEILVLLTNLGANGWQSVTVFASAVVHIVVIREAKRPTQTEKLVGLKNFPSSTYFGSEPDQTWQFGAHLGKELHRP